MLNKIKKTIVVIGVLATATMLTACNSGAAGTPASADGGRVGSQDYDQFYVDNNTNKVLYAETTWRDDAEHGHCTDSNRAGIIYTVQPGDTETFSYSSEGDYYKADCHVVVNVYTDSKRQNLLSVEHARYHTSGAPTGGGWGNHDTPPRVCNSSQNNIVCYTHITDGTNHLHLILDDYSPKLPVGNYVNGIYSQNYESQLFELYNVEWINNNASNPKDLSSYFLRIEYTNTKTQESAVVDTLYSGLAKACQSDLSQPMNLDLYGDNKGNLGVGCHQYNATANAIVNANFPYQHKNPFSPNYDTIASGRICNIEDLIFSSDGSGDILMQYLCSGDGVTPLVPNMINPTQFTESYIDITTSNQYGLAANNGGKLSSTSITLGNWLNPGFTNINGLGAIAWDGSVGWFTFFDHEATSGEYMESINTSICDSASSTINLSKITATNFTSGTSYGLALSCKLNNSLSTMITAHSGQSGALGNYVSVDGSVDTGRQCVVQNYNPTSGDLTVVCLNGAKGGNQNMFNHKVVNTVNLAECATHGIQESVIWSGELACN